MKKFFTLFGIITMSALAGENLSLNLNVPEKIHYDTEDIPQKETRFFQNTTVQKNYPYYKESYVNKRQQKSKFNKKHGKDTSHIQRRYDYKSKK
ncbi:MAG: hypothetical protein IJ481_03230 [Alphaproteobacteria bacterium]|nr:hypothetical protein [Alphaproteobacteria bacterium]